MALALAELGIILLLFSLPAPLNTSMSILTGARAND